MKVILDNGHGRDTAGKRSPDGRLREYAYAREMARKIAQDLKRQGIDVSLLVPEDTDVPLKERVERAEPDLCGNWQAGYTRIDTCQCRR